MSSDLFWWGWVLDHKDDVWLALGEHIWLTVVAVVLGFLISFPVAVYAFRNRWALGPTTAVTGTLYTIPSLALFAALIPFTGAFSTATAEIPLVTYTLLILIRNIVAGLDGVDGDVKEAAQGMGYSQRQLLWRVEIPLALPAIVAGLRIATVTTIGLVTVTAVLGKGGFGYFILFGLTRSFTTAILLGAIASMVLAIGADVLLLWIERWLAPWQQAGRVEATA